MAEIYYYLGHEQFQPEVLVKHAQLAEKTGFDGIFISEHFNPWVADKGASGFGFTTLGAIAATTQRIKLMTGVVTPLYRYHPAVVAQAAATIDRISNGRFILGVGTGESINETPLGYAFPKYKERSARIKEALTIMKQLLAGDKLTFAGEYYQTKNARLYSPPLHDIPILLAAGGPKTAETAGEIADGIIISVKNASEALELICIPARKKATETGKENFLLTASRWTVFAHNKDEACHALLPWRGLRAPSRDVATDPEQLQREADALPKEEIISRYTLLSSAKEYIEAYKSLITFLSADIIVIQTTSRNQEYVIDMLGKEVLPELKKLKI